MRNDCTIVIRKVTCKPTNSIGLVHSVYARAVKSDHSLEKLIDQAVTGCLIRTNFNEKD